MTLSISRRALLRIATGAGLAAGGLLAACTRAPAPHSDATSVSRSSLVAEDAPRTPTVAKATLTASSALPATSRAASPAAIVYLNDALDYMEQYSELSMKIDWRSLRHDAMTRAAFAQSPEDTYDAIRSALQQLGDHHSSFFTPEQWKSFSQGQAGGLGITLMGGVVVEVFAGGPAAQAGVRVRDVVTTLNGRSFADAPANQMNTMNYPEGATARLALRRGEAAQAIEVALTGAVYSRNRPPCGLRLAEDLGYLELPAFEGMGDEQIRYATRAHQAIRAADQPPARGWVVDLRLNSGGNMYPMLAGVGPILGEGDAGGFVDGRGGRQTFSYHDGQAWLDAASLVAVSPPAYSLARPLAPVAVLTGGTTASAGEAIALAFRERPKTRSFGAPTLGVPTANRGKPMSDGAWLIVTIALDADRTGKTYDAAISPDEYVAMNWTLFQTKRDPVLMSVLAWLNSTT